MIQQLLQDKLGFCGKMISGSKSGYLERHPDNVAIFNANLCTKDAKVWYGDIDLTLSKDLLSELAVESNETIYILYEMDARFENEEKPLIRNAVAVFYPDGTHSAKHPL